jgi:hypothetical protein
MDIEIFKIIYLQVHANSFSGSNFFCLKIHLFLTIEYSGIIWAYQAHENKIREAGGRNTRLEGLSKEDEALLGHRHPGFRWVSQNLFYIPN